jgi:1-acyl-sn-glycerol-3-phosphate acyltransferase
MASYRDIGRTLFSRAVIACALIVGLPFIILMMVLPARVRYQSRVLFWGITIFYDIVIKAALVPISYKGEANIPDEPVVFAENHQSAVDIPLVGILPRGKPHVWLARQELMRWKLLRWVLPRLAVVVDTTSKEKAMRSMINLLRLVEQIPVDIMIFPEGGRYSDGAIHPFYGGFVTIAKLLNRPVVPVYIAGAHKVYPANTFWTRSYPICVTVGAPFMRSDQESDEAFKDRVHAWFVAQAKG